MSVQSISLLDGSQIPWLAWGCVHRDTQLSTTETGLEVLKAGIRHIDTAQAYGTEVETGEIVTKSETDKKKIYVTSKLSKITDPVPVDQVKSAVEESIKKLGFIPDLFLIHNPFVPASPSDLKATWGILEDLKGEGKLKSIGVSNFRPQDLELILDGAKYKPVVNQIEYHPYVLTHLGPLLELQEKHGIVTEAYGPLTPINRHPTGGPLKPILERIAARLSAKLGKHIDITTVLLLWTRARGVVAVTSSGSVARIDSLGETAVLPADLLEPEEVNEITSVGKTVHFRHYREHMEEDFPLPSLSNGE